MSTDLYFTRTLCQATTPEYVVMQTTGQYDDELLRLIIDIEADNLGYINPKPRVYCCVVLQTQRELEVTVSISCCICLNDVPHF
jgi:hypothetical protein